MYTVYAECNMYGIASGWSLGDEQPADFRECGIYHVHTLDGWEYARAEHVFPNATHAAGDIEKYNTTFVRNEDVAGDDDSAILPYNSTIWWSGVYVELAAPFLEFGWYNETSCNWFDNSLGVCLCLGNKPVMEDWRTGDNLRCISEMGYVWGFSSFVLFVGIVLEASWLISCWLCWSVSSVGSKLIRHGRPGTGRVRNILDVAGVITDEIGRDTGIYSDDKLYEELKKCPPVGYVVEEGKDSDHIRLTALGTGTGRRHRRFKIRPARRYG